MEIEQVPADEWDAWVDRKQGAVILDVRQPDEWMLGTLPEAVKISLPEIPTSLDALDPAAPTLVVCRTGSRSHQVAQYLALSGFEEVANLAGGLKALGMQP